VLAACTGGCVDGKFGLSTPWDSPSDRRPEPAERPVPEPLHLLLPQAISIEPFTATRTFDEAGGIKGIEVEVKAKDAYGDGTKAFGKFAFALYRYHPGSPSRKGGRIATWEEDLLAPRKNLLHWDRFKRAYKFKLQWYRPIPVGSKFILSVDFSSPFTQRKFAEREFVSGE
jgi:hypothetical protein